MIIIDIGAGFCNQAYAFFGMYILAQKYNQEIVLNCTEADKTVFKHGYVLDLIQVPVLKKIHYAIYNLDDADYLANIKKECICLVWQNKKIEGENMHQCSTLEDVEHWLNEKDNFWITGFWTIGKYLKNGKRIINKMLKTSFKSSFYEKFMNEIDGKNMVGVHIRRGDLLELSWTIKLNVEYYKAAICWFKKNIEKCKFFFFSDDIEWAKKELGCDSSYYFVESLAGIDGDIEEFLCLTKCKYKVLSNSSTFSSLSFELNEDTRKIKLLYNPNKEMLTTEEIIKDNEAYFLYTFLEGREQDYIKYLSIQEIEELCKNYKIDNICQGMDSHQIEYLEKKEIRNKKEAEEWLYLCDELSLNSYNIRREKTKRQIKLKKLNALILTEQYGKANTLAYRISYLEMRNPAFIQQYIQVLLKCGCYWSAMVEMTRYRYLCNNVSDLENQVVDKFIIDTFSSKKKYAFYLFSSELLFPYIQANDAVDVGFILLRLGGHEVSFIFNANCMAPVHYEAEKNNPGFYADPDKIRQGHYNSYTYENVLEDKSIFDKKENKELETVIIVSTLESLQQCIGVKCKKIIFRYNDSTIKEKERVEKYIQEQYPNDLQILESIEYIYTEKEERKFNTYKRVCLESVYSKEIYNYKFVYDMLNVLNKYLY